MPCEYLNMSIFGCCFYHTSFQCGERFIYAVRKTPFPALIYACISHPHFVWVSSHAFQRYFWQLSTKWRYSLRAGGGGGEKRGDALTTCNAINLRWSQRFLDDDATGNLFPRNGSYGHHDYHAVESLPKILLSSCSYKKAEFATF